MLSAPGCGDGASAGPTAAPPAPRHVAIVVLDALHAAHLSHRGGPPGLTPNIDALAAAGRRFDAAFSNAAWTLPSTASLMTGRLPERHGVLTDHHALPPEAVTLAELFRDAGWRTASFVQMVYASGSFGLDQGFADVHDFAVPDEHNQALLVHDAAAWIDAHAGERTLAYIHLRRPHGPYDPPAAVLRRLPPLGLPADGARRGLLLAADSRVKSNADLEPGEREAAVRLYQANLAAIDEAIAPLLRRLRARDDTLVVLTSDHGEAFGQHDAWGHGGHVWAETLDVPLVLAGPGVVPGADEAPACTVDLLPTLLELCAVPGAERLALDGVSLAGRLAGAPAPRRPPVPVSARYTGANVPALALFDGDWKLRLEPDGSTALYERRNDRGEETDVAASEPQRARAMADAARAWRDEHAGAASRATADPVLPAERIESLRALGYVR